MANSWYPFFPGDYARDTAHLTLQEHGAYRLLLDHYYSTGRPIPADLERAFCICRAFTSELQASVRSVLEQFFTETPDGWRNQRADRQIEKQQRMSEKYAARAKNAAAARWEHEHATSMRQAMLEASEPEPEPKPKKNPPPLLKKSFVHSKEKGFSQIDFDARDLRKLAQAREEIELKLTNGWGSTLTGEEIWEHQCALAGVSVQQAEDVIERVKKRPRAQMMEASA